MEVLRLVLVDDYRMVTEALASRLSTAPDLWVAGCCQTDDARLPEIIRWLRPDIVLIDVEPLGFAVAEVLSRIRAAWPDAHIIVVSADDDISHAVEAARAGADAWVSKNQGADHLETVLRGVAQGHSWFPPEMLGEVLRGLRDDVRDARESSNLLDTLSPRELDVLTSMAKGKRARQIAAELMISADTVRTHTRSIFGKLEVHSRIEAVSVAWAAGLRPAEPQAPADSRPREVQRRPAPRRPGPGQQPADRTGRGQESARRAESGRSDTARAEPGRQVSRGKPSGATGGEELASGRAAGGRTGGGLTGGGFTGSGFMGGGFTGGGLTSSGLTGGGLPHGDVTHGELTHGGRAAGGSAADARRTDAPARPGDKKAANGATAESGAS